MITLQSPEYIWIAAMGLVLWCFDYWHFFRKAPFVVPGRYFSGKKVTLRSFVFLVGVAAWVLLAIAIAGPKEQLGRKESKRKLNDVVFVLDVSGSMRTVDFQPNRLEAAKQKILEFIKMRPKDRIGVIIFGQKAFTLLPLTTDMTLIEKSINEIDFNYAGIGSGTNIGDAIGLAVARCALSEAKNKTIILLTDGVTNAGSLTPVQSAKEALDAGIKIHVIGIGSSGSASMMPVVDQKGRTRVDRWGRVLMQKTPGGGVDQETMLEVVKITGGSLHQASDADGLKNVFKNIDKLERANIKQLEQFNYKYHYYKFLLMGVILLLGAEILRRFVIKEVS